MPVKVYFNDKPLFLTDNIDSEIEPFVHHDDAVFIDEFSAPSINSMIHEMKQNNVHAGIFYHADLEKLKKAFARKFTPVRAAGGVVVNDSGETLFIHRRGKWDLPKGKLDPGESPEKCAEREVSEETGVKKPKVKKHILDTYHTYDENGKHYLKETSWYLMHSADQPDLHPQTNEQITEARWVSPSELPTYTKNTFALIVDVLKAAGYAVDR